MSVARRTPIWATGEAQSAVDPSYRKLLTAVLEAAWQDLRQRPDWVPATWRSANVANRDLEREWLLSDEVRPFSFLWICQGLALDPDALRDAMLTRPPPVQVHPRPSEVSSDD